MTWSDRWHPCHRPDEFPIHESKRLRSSLEKIHVGLALVAAALAIWSLIGWLAGIPLFTSFAAQRPSLSIMTATLLLIGAAASIAPSMRGSLKRGPGLVEFAAGIWIVSSHYFPAVRVAWIPSFAWSSLFTGSLFALSGAASVALCSAKTTIGQVLSFALLLCASLIGLGHLFPSTSLYQHLPGTGVAIPTALAFAALALSKLFARPHEGIASAFTSTGAAGLPGLRILFFGLLGISLSATAILEIYRSAAIDAESALVILAWSALAMLAGTLWALAAKVDRLEKARNAAALQNERVQQTLTAAITHDLRSPLHTATILVDLLQRTVTAAYPRSLLEKLKRSHRRLDRLLRSMLDNLSFANGRKIALHFSEVDLGQLAQEVVSENSSVLENRVTVEGSAVGWWDRDTLFRVLENLLLNARKYGHPASEIRCRISRFGLDRASVRITNQGPPIPLEEWERIFEPFRRGHVTENSAKPGWGVGLAFSRLVSIEHGGQLRVLSSSDDATTFELQLPADARPKSAGHAMQPARRGG